jgi:hypothetical protein
VSQRSFDAEADAPMLRDFVDRLMTITEETFEPRISVDFETDDLGVMALAFTSKQYDHLWSILVLLDAGKDRDAGLIVRTMAEGMALLLWAAQDPQTRPGLWRGYAHVADWRLMRANDLSGQPVDPALRAQVDTYLQAHGAQYHKPYAIQRQVAGLPLPDDPYRREWYNVDIASVFRAVRGEPLYERIYREMSDWVHWGIDPIGRSLTFEQERIWYSEREPYWAATALAAGFQSLYQSLSFLNDYLHLQIGDRLSSLYNERIAWHSALR